MISSNKSIDKSDVILVIPARYSSSRLPGKPLLDIAGKPMIQHVFERAKASSFSKVYIATDDKRIESVANDFGANVIMTSDAHESGSDRLAEVVEILALADETIVVNLQGDEPLTPVENLEQVAESLSSFPEASMATLLTPITNTKDFYSPNVVKVVSNRLNNAMYFSRAMIPYARDENDNFSTLAQRHIGIYAYRAEFLKRFVEMPMCQLEQDEKLEQLRALYHGDIIHVEEAKTIPYHGVDTEEDLIKVTEIIRHQMTE